MVYSKRVWQNFFDLRRAMNERGVDVLFFGGGSWFFWRSCRSSCTRSSCRSTTGSTQRCGIAGGCPIPALSYGCISCVKSHKTLFAEMSYNSCHSNVLSGNCSCGIKLAYNKVKVQFFLREVCSKACCFRKTDFMYRSMVSGNSRAWSKI
jgi:hypothetical protein